jgi:2-iminobutanoate/2-iminopropanoate deaminase
MIAAMSHQPVRSDRAPAAIGPYSQAVVTTARRLIYCSGQIPLDPASGQIVGAGDVRAQTERVMANLRAVLEASGATFADVVKTTIYLTDLQDFALVNEVYGAHFLGGTPPARATIQVAGLPRGAQVEIDAVAAVD